MDNLKEIASKFEIHGEVESVVPFGAGLINDTYRVTTTPTDTSDYMLQRINHAIFRDVEMLQRNIARVTDHIRERLTRRGETDIERKALRLVPVKGEGSETGGRREPDAGGAEDVRGEVSARNDGGGVGDERSRGGAESERIEAGERGEGDKGDERGGSEGKLYYFDGRSYWRVTVLIPGARSFEQVTPELAYSTGRAFGDFQGMLADLPGEPLGATIPDFHNIEFRLRQLDEAVREDRAGRVAEMRVVIDEIARRADEMCLAERLAREGKLPRRTSHCDTKVANVLFDGATGEVLCVIDLDTTMPGFAMSDFGDFIRTAGNTGAEDDRDTARVGLDMEIFRAFARGYVETAGAFLTDVEIELLPFGARLLTYMQTVRFLTDYLAGDTYYKISSPDHNRARTLAQLAMLHSLERHEKEMKDYIDSIKRTV